MTEEKKPHVSDLNSTPVEEEEKDRNETDEAANANDEPENQSSSSSEEDNLEAKESQIDDYVNRLQRLQAEFDNFRKRQERERIFLKDLVTEGNALEILPVIDNFERALTASEKDNITLESHVTGMRMIFQQLEGVLTILGVKRMDVLGQPFCPEKHEAVSKAHSEEVEKDKVLQVLQPGWLMQDKVIRHAVVIVSDGPKDSSSEGEDDNDKETSDE